MKYLICVYLLVFGFSVTAQTNLQDSLDNIQPDLSFLDSIKIPPVKIERETKKEQHQSIFCDYNEVPARFGGGMDSFYALINQHLDFPNNAKKGRVMVCFVVDTTGKMTDIEIRESPSEVNSKEVLRVIHLISKTHYWTPVTQRGKKVRVRIAIPIVCRKREKY